MEKLRKYIREKIAFLVREELKKKESVSDIAGARIHPTARVISSLVHGNVKIEEGVFINKCRIAGNDISIGRFTSLSGPNTTIYSEVNSIKIGNFCSIARNIDIQEWNHPTNKLTSYLIENRLFETDIRKEMESKGDIVIGHDVWIGAQAVVLSGAKIGNGAIIGANAVVTGNVPPFAIVVGNPGQVIKYRFDKETIKKIENLAWWYWDVEKIKQNMNLFRGVPSEMIFEKKNE